MDQDLISLFKVQEKTKVSKKIINHMQSAKSPTRYHYTATRIVILLKIYAQI